jgi:hypothetical protein
VYDTLYPPDSDEFPHRTEMTRYANRRHAKEASTHHCSEIETAVTTCDDKEYCWERMSVPFVWANGG